MKVMGTCRMQILRESYVLFLHGNVEKVTINELEKATKRIRGAIFYHFKGKLKLLESIVEELFLPSFNIPSEIVEAANEASFEDFIKVYKSPEERVINIIKTEFKVDEPDFCYFNFMNQAKKYYPDFSSKYAKVIDLELSVWNAVIEKNRDQLTFFGDRTKEIAAIFMHLSTGLFFQKGYYGSFVSDNAALLHRLSNCLSKQEE